MQLAKGEWASQARLWLIGTLIIAFFLAPKMSLPLAIGAIGAPLILSILLFLRVRWAPEFLLATCALAGVGILLIAFAKGFTLMRVVALLSVTLGAIFPYRLLKVYPPDGDPTEGE